MCLVVSYSVRSSLFYLLNYSVRESRTGRNITCKALKLDRHCDGYWAKLLHSYIKLPSSCPEESLARLKYALDILKAAATEIFKDDNYPPAIVLDDLSQTLKQPDGKRMVQLLQDLLRIFQTRSTLVYYLHPVRVLSQNEIKIICIKITW